MKEFFNAAANLKKIQRQGWIDKLSIENPESVADHSYSMAMMGMIISDTENYNSEKILKMILLHDLAESEIGDFIPGEIPIEEKNKLENNAFSKIIKTLPDNVKTEYETLWNDYQKKESSEAKIVHQLDRLEMAFQAKIYQNEGHSKEKLSTFFESAKKEIIHPKLKELFRNIIDEK
ncbi:HD domain-containing protein [Nitrosopumilus cobalaminigenes]|uniref:HD domain-containing protein n=1 Tax=Nitrosopumilus cobalaminigenes TaxID=1470066 RepID=UPI001FEA5B56|nr:HD domain-containing protein [Nitrosopumilus cobalaminigenes]